MQLTISLLFVAALIHGIARAETTTLPGDHVEPSRDFISKESEPRQHTFIQLGNKGKFGYHVSLFLSNHQHQLIVGSELTIAGKSAAQLERILSAPAENGYFTVLTDPPRFPLGDILQGKRKTISVDLYDGIIGIDNERKLLTEATYKITNIIFTTPMHIEDKALAQSHYIIFGNEGGPQTTYYMAHLMWGEDTFDQLIEIELKEPAQIANGTILTIANQPSTEPLIEGSLHSSIAADNPEVAFTVKRQIHFRPAPSLQ